MNSQVRRCSQMLVVVLLLAISGSALAAVATKDEAVAMVKKAVAAINTEGAEKVYAEISDPKGPFVDRDLYIVVCRMDGLVLAHGADKSRVGTNQLHDKDVDGKEFMKERLTLAETEAELLAELQVHESGDQDDRAEADVLRAAQRHGRLRWGLRLYGVIPA